jgi:hypothetical protein
MLVTRRSRDRFLKIPKRAKDVEFEGLLFRNASEERAQSKDRLWGLSIAPAKQSRSMRNVSG